MTTKYFLAPFSFLALIGSGLALLMPVLPALAVTSEVNNINVTKKSIFS